MVLVCISSQASAKPTTQPSGGTGCGSTGCFQNPPNCQAASSGCMFASWIYVSSDDECCSKDSPAVLYRK